MSGDRDIKKTERAAAAHERFIEWMKALRARQTDLLRRVIERADKEQAEEIRAEIKNDGST